MTQVVEFPQRQHQEFRRLVFKAVFDAARVQQMDIENYISAIYQDGENPPLFASTHSLNRVYLRFKDLIRQQSALIQKLTDFLGIIVPTYAFAFICITFA